MLAMVSVVVVCPLNACSDTNNTAAKHLSNIWLDSSDQIKFYSGMLVKRLTVQGP
jgi:hypothetical protein